GWRRCRSSQSVVYGKRIILPVARFRSNLYCLFRHFIATRIKCTGKDRIGTCDSYKSKRLLAFSEKHRLSIYSKETDKNGSRCRRNGRHALFKKHYWKRFRGVSAC